MEREIDSLVDSADKELQLLLGILGDHGGSWEGGDRGNTKHKGGTDQRYGLHEGRELILNTHLSGLVRGWEEIHLGRAEGNEWGM